MCLNKKVVVALAAAALAVWVLAPGAIAGALPVLVLAACPLSMLFMMRGMRTPQRGNADHSVTDTDDDLDQLRREVHDLRSAVAQRSARTRGGSR